MENGYIDKLAGYLSAHYYTETGRKQIPYGVQLTFTDGSNAYTVRVYQNAKGRITLDASQIKDDSVRLCVASFSPDAVRYPLMDAPLIGTDEAGKGDYFGPLCVCALYADEAQYLRLKALGVRDSKTLTDERIRLLAAEIAGISPHISIVKIGNAKFNALHAKTGNINAIMGWAHATAVKNVLKNVTCKNVLTDKFGSEHWLATNLKGLNLTIAQQPKAEQNTAVAAASILARSAFVEIDALNKKYAVRLPLGAGGEVDKAAAEIVAKYGAAILNDVAKTSFKNTLRILNEEK
jgi:ribonuclease HIII